MGTRNKEDEVITTVVGGQFGSEGKGKVCYLLGKDADCMVRCGGPNAGHTANGYTLRQLPVGAMRSDCKLVIPNGAIIDKEVLKKEITFFGISPSRLFIGPNVGIIDGLDKYNEEEIRHLIGSTKTGSGECSIRRMSRRNYSIAKLDNDLSKFIEDPQVIYNQSSNIFIEGTQGFGLSLFHSPYYPFVTSRDTTVSGFLSESGLPYSDEVILVLRKFPIRVGGNSGPLPYETSWEALNLRPEFTSVTRKVRRVGYFDREIVGKSIKVNKPTKIVLNHMDYRPDISVYFEADFYGYGPNSLEIKRRIK